MAGRQAETYWQGSENMPTMYIASMDIRTAFDVARPKSKKSGRSEPPWWITAVFLFRGMRGLKGQATFESVDSTFNYTWCIRQGSVEAPTLWLTWAEHLRWNVEKEGNRIQMEIHIDKKQRGRHQICSILWADNLRVVLHSKIHLEQMMQELIEEAER